MKFSYEDFSDPIQLADIKYTYEIAPRPDRLKAIAETYTFTFMETDECVFCWAQRNGGKLIGMGEGASKEDARNAAREIAGKDFDGLPVQELPDIDTRGLKLV